jgi:hypothetical protein
VNASLSRKAGVVLLTAFTALGSWAASGTAAVTSDAPGPVVAAVSHTATNPVVDENKRPGTTKWQAPWPGYTTADDIHLQIKGFATKDSVEGGQSISFKVTTTPAQQFSVDVFRLGYYGGKGGHFMGHLAHVPGTQQPACVAHAGTGLLSCANWADSFSLKVPKAWLSGVYVAVLTNAGKFQSIAPFWVTDHARHSDVLMLSSLNTYEAYNDFPYDPPASDPEGLPQTGKSLYDFSSAGSVPANKVTFDRPFSSQYGGPGEGGLYDFEPELIQYLEKVGYDVTYTDDVDLDAHPGQLLGHKAVVVGGHAEYWTKAMREGTLAARDKGIGLAFISANEIYWQVRYENNRRILVGYKDAKPDPVADPSLRTIRWRDLGKPEQKIIGVQFPTDGNQDWGGQPYVPKNTWHWAYAGTGMTANHAVDGEVVGYEIDSYDPSVGKPPGKDYTILASSPFVNFDARNFTHNSSIYRATGGNFVWATGSMDWAWALSPGGSSDGVKDNVRSQMQIMTVNVLNKMIATAH